MPHGVLFRGNSEADIRRKLIKQGYIKGIIGLPANLFYGTGIPACIIVLDKAGAADRKGIFIIDASKGFIKDGNKNRLRAQDIHKIVDAFNREFEIPGYSRMVPVTDIGNPKNNYNLNIPRYIDSSEPEDLQDIEAHLRGGISDADIDALGQYWQVFPSLKAALFKPADRPGYSLLKVEPDGVRQTVFSHPEFTAFGERVSSAFNVWRSKVEPQLAGITVGDHPKEFLTSISESLLEEFEGLPLLDPYDVYQHLLDYWEATMQDDVYQLVQDGWTALVDGQPNTDLIPKHLVIARYFSKEQAAIEQLEAERDTVSQQMEEMDSEQGNEEGLLYEVKNDKGKYTKGAVNARLKEIDKDSEAEDERRVLNAFTDLMEKEAALNKQVKESQKSLDAEAKDKYEQLTENEIKMLAVADKWFASIEQCITSELQRASRGLTSRVHQLAVRYEEPLPVLQSTLEELSNKVEAHLKAMGAQW
jgi:type I restriction enzyme M protein